MKTMAYNMNQCANPWDNEEFLGEVTLGADTRISNYLNSLGLNDFEYKIENEIFLAITCMACTCPSGNVLYLDFEYSKNLENILLEEGFYHP